MGKEENTGANPGGFINEWKGSQWASIISLTDDLHPVV